MIFITVGTGRFPFERLIKCIDEAIINHKIEEEVFGQIGKYGYKPKSFPCKEFIGFDEMVKNIQNADIIVSHAGVGSLLLCLNLGKIPILFPRDAALGELLDNHQFEFAKKIDSLGRALVAFSENDLIFKIHNYKTLIASAVPHSNSEGCEKLIYYLKKICN